MMFKKLIIYIMRQIAIIYIIRGSRSYFSSTSESGALPA